MQTEQAITTGTLGLFIKRQVKFVFQRGLSWAFNDGRVSFSF